MARDYIHDGPAEVRSNLAGDLEANDATRPEQDWHIGFSTISDRALIIDLSAVTAIDETTRNRFASCYTGASQARVADSPSQGFAPSIPEWPSPSIWNEEVWQ
jgi:hypothetical protein